MCIYVYSYTQIQCMYVYVYPIIMMWKLITWSCFMVEPIIEPTQVGRQLWNRIPYVQYRGCAMPRMVCHCNCDWSILNSLFGRTSCEAQLRVPMGRPGSISLCRRWAPCFLWRILWQIGQTSERTAQHWYWQTGLPDDPAKRGMLNLATSLMS